MTNHTAITIRRPDDYHLHLRDGEMLKLVTPDSSRDFARAIIMPNLVPPVTTTALAEAYKARIEEAIPTEHDFRPLMTLYLTESTDADDLELGAKSGLISAVKLYPAGATTNSDSGVKSIERVYPVLERMAEIGLPLCVHGEVTDADIDIFDREAVFIERVFRSYPSSHPGFASRYGTYHDERRRRLRSLRGERPGSYAHNTPLDHQPQSYLGGRHQTSLLLPACC